jgi:hypothetical protein
MFARSMKSPALLVASLFILPILAGSVLSSGHGSRLGSYLSTPADAYGDRPGYGDAYGHRLYGFAGSDGGYTSGDLPEWVREPSRTDSYGASPSEPQSDLVQRGRSRAFPSPYQERSFGEGSFSLPRTGPVPGGYEPDGFGMRGELPPAAARGYRFRGDGIAGFGGWGALPQSGGYQFRPLTEPERQRIDSLSGWRPLGPDRSGQEVIRPVPSPAREAYGYRSESWVDRYYGDRP